MNIYNIGLKSASYDFASSFKKNVDSVLNFRQKQIIAIVLFALGCIAACYLAFPSIFKKFGRSKSVNLEPEIQKSEPRKTLESSKPEIPETPKNGIEGIGTERPKAESPEKPAQVLRTPFSPRITKTSPDPTKLSLSKPKSSFSPPDAVLMQIFSMLDYQEWKKLSKTDKHFKSLSKNPQVIAAILENDAHSIPNDEKIKLAKLAGTHLTKLDLNETTVNFREFPELLKSCPNLIELHFPNVFETNGVLSLNLPKEMEEELAAALPKGLKILKFSNLEVSPEIFKKIMKMSPDLIELSCPQLEMTAEMVRDLPKNLINMDFANMDVDPSVLKAFFKAFPNLIELSLPWKMVDEVISDLPTGLKILHSLNGEKLSKEVYKLLPSGLEVLEIKN